MATTKRSTQELLGIIRDYLTQDCGGWLDSCEANIRMIASRITKPDSNGLEFEQSLQAAIAQGGLIENQQIKNAIDSWLTSNRDYANIQANRDLLRLAFLYPTGKLNGSPITLPTLQAHAQALITNDQLARSAESVQAERETQQAIAQGTRDVQEQTKMVAEILSVWKISKNPYGSSTPGEISQRDYDKKEDELFALPLAELRQKHAVIMEKRAMRNMTPAELKIKVRGDYQKQQAPVERYIPLPSALVFDGHVHPTKIDREVILWVQKFDRPRWEFWVQKYSLAALAARMEGK